VQLLPPFILIWKRRETQFHINNQNKLNIEYFIHPDNYIFGFEKWCRRSKFFDIEKRGQKNREVVLISIWGKELLVWEM
jgi:hypothetical protein